jgi:hypothetical protein
MVLMPTERRSFAASRLWASSRAEQAESPEQPDLIADHAGHQIRDEPAGVRENCAA